MCILGKLCENKLHTFGRWFLFLYLGSVRMWKKACGDGEILQTKKKKLKHFFLNSLFFDWNIDRYSQDLKTFKFNCSLNKFPTVGIPFLTVDQSNTTSMYIFKLKRWWIKDLQRNHCWFSEFQALDLEFYDKWRSSIFFSYFRSSTPPFK